MTKRIRCKLCYTMISDRFNNKWNHLMKRHPDVWLARLISMALDPQIAEWHGRNIARKLLEYMK